MVVVAYILFGGQFLLSTEFIGTTLLVVFVFSMLWLIAQLDRRVQAKRFRKNSPNS
jgi:predicted membrane protein